MYDPIFIVLNQKAFVNCVLERIEGGRNLRTSAVVGRGTRPDLLKVGEPFLMVAEALELKGNAERQIATSPIVKIQVDCYDLLIVKIETSTGSVYRISYSCEEQQLV